MNRPRKKAKSAVRTVVLSNCTTVQSISPIIAKLKGWLPPQQKAAALAVMTNLSVSYCEKVLTGARDINVEMYRALLHSDFGPTLLQTEFSAASPAWFKTFEKGRMVSDAAKRIAQLKRELNALQEGMADVD